MIAKTLKIPVEHYYQIQACVQNTGLAFIQMLEIKNGYASYNLIHREEDFPKLKSIYRICEFAENNPFIPLVFPKTSASSESIEQTISREKIYVRVISVISFFSVFGLTHLHKAITESGCLISWTSPKNRTEVGEYEITGRFKKSFKSFDRDDQISILNYVKIHKGEYEN